MRQSFLVLFNKAASSRAVKHLLLYFLVKWFSWRTPPCTVHNVPRISSTSCLRWVANPTSPAASLTVMLLISRGSLALTTVGEGLHRCHLLKSQIMLVQCHMSLPQRLFHPKQDSLAEKPTTRTQLMNKSNERYFPLANASINGGPLAQAFKPAEQAAGMEQLMSKRSSHCALYWL